QLDVFGAVKFLRRLGERLREKRDVLDADRLLARICDLQMAVHTDQIAEIQQLDQLPLLLGKLGLRAHELNAAGPVLDVKKLELSLVVAEHDPTGDPDVGTDLSLLGWTQLARLANGLVPVETLSPRIEPQHLNGLEFFEASNFKAVRFRHETQGQIGCNSKSIRSAAVRSQVFAPVDAPGRRTVPLGIANYLSSLSFGQGQPEAWCPG